MQQTGKKTYHHRSTELILFFLVYLYRRLPNLTSSRSSANLFLFVGPSHLILQWLRIWRTHRAFLPFNPAVDYFLGRGVHSSVCFRPPSHLIERRRVRFSASRSWMSVPSVRPAVYQNSGFTPAWSVSPQWLGERGAVAWVVCCISAHVPLIPRMSVVVTACLPLTILPSLVVAAPNHRTAPRTPLTTIPINSRDQRKPPVCYTVVRPSFSRVPIGGPPSSP